LLLGAILWLPFAARPAQRSGAPVRKTLIIMSPHDAAIRWEFTQAFVARMKDKGVSVELDWRNPGGGTEITRILESTYAQAFERYWTGSGERWSAEIASKFTTPCNETKHCTEEVRRANEAYLKSNVSSDIDLLFGGGSADADLNAEAGRLVDSGFVRKHPELFPANGQTVGGEPYWDPKGRWVGVSLSGLGICYNRDALKRLGPLETPDSWESLANPAYRGQLALADPGKSGSALKAFEMLVQEQMRIVDERAAASGAVDAARKELAPREGWQAALRLIQRLAANARYFSDAASSVPVDVAIGNAAAGMCIDSYGGLEREATAAAGDADRMGFALPDSGTSIGADTIGVLRGAPHPDLALEFMEFVMSEEGQKIWSFRRGAPGGPKRHGLHRLPVLRALYASAYDAYRSDPNTNPYNPNRRFVYHKEWTHDIYRDIAFVIKVLCVDPEPELQDAYAALADRGFPHEATALFEDVSAVDYGTLTKSVHDVLRSGNAVARMDLTTKLVRHFRDQYRRVGALARASREAP
jgi:ABC-type Fe3+ transport system substrate-binding protein